MSISRNPQADAAGKQTSRNPFIKALRTTQQYLSKLFSTNIVALKIGELAVTLPLVVTPTFILNWLFDMRSIDPKNAYRLDFIIKYFKSNPRNLMKGYFASYGQAAAKNLTLVSSDHVHDHVHNGLIGRDRAKISLMSRVSATIVTILVVIGIDLGLTNPFANARFFSQRGKMPQLNSFSEWLKFGYLGWGTRASALFVGSGGYIASKKLVKEPMDALLPPEQYGAFSPFLTTVSTGWIAGLMSNSLYVIRNNQLELMREMKLPTAWFVSKQLYREGGAKAFMRGGMIGGGYNVVVYGALGYGEHLFHNVMFPDVRRSSAKSLTKTIAIDEDESVTPEVEAVDHTEIPTIYREGHKSTLFQPKPKQIEAKPGKTTADEAKPESKEAKLESKLGRK